MLPTHTKALAAVLVTTVLGFVIGKAVLGDFRSAMEIKLDGYALRDAAWAIIEHLEVNGEWPRDSNSLRSSFRHSHGELRSDNDWSDLLTRVEIDFDVDPSTLATDKQGTNPHQPPFRVVWLRNGGDYYFAGWEPNGMILTYLNDRMAGQESGTDADKPRSSD